MKDILDIYTTDLEPILNIEGFLPSLVFQPLQLAVISNFKKNGGNALGISEDDGPLISKLSHHKMFATHPVLTLTNQTVMDINFTWGDAEDDDRAQNVALGVIAKATELAKSRGLYHPYLYQNYAYITQDVLSSYGPRNKKRLLRIQGREDPRRVFRDLQPGYFKLRV